MNNIDLLLYDMEPVVGKNEGLNPPAAYSGHPSGRTIIVLHCFTVYRLLKRRSLTSSMHASGIYS